MFPDIKTTRKRTTSHAEIQCMDTSTTAPTPFNIPAATVQRWVNVPNGQPLNAPLTRADLDNLFFSIDLNIKATFNLQQSLIHYTNGRLDEANQASALAGTNLAEASNRLRVFMNAIMASAEVKRERGPTRRLPV